jgi:hypothetical protein
MKHFWRAVNIAFVGFCAWSGYWGVAAERAYDHRSVVPVGPGYPAISFSCVVIFLMSGIYSFITFRNGCLHGSAFRLPSWDRNPFRTLSDPLQAIGIPLIALVAATVVATVRFLFGSTLGLGDIVFLCSWDIGMFVGALIAYAIYRPRIVVV